MGSLKLGNVWGFVQLIFFPRCAYESAERCPTYSSVNNEPYCKDSPVAELAESPDDSRDSAAPRRAHLPGVVRPPSPRRLRVPPPEDLEPDCGRRRAEHHLHLQDEVGRLKSGR